MTFDTNGFATAYSAPLQGRFRVDPSDFRVDEQMKITLSGDGEHLWLRVQKTSANTDWVAKQVAQVAGVVHRDVGYAGLKDRHAVTTQWFSVWLPGMADPDFSALPAEIEILEQHRHDKKLKRGTLSRNGFTLILREVSGDADEALQICQQISQHGLPNYYGVQRFGHHFGNLHKAERWFKGELRPKQRNQRSLYLSAARSWIFNHVLSERIRQGNWGQRLAGDVLMFEGGNSWFADDGSAELEQRLAEQAIHPTGVLWGRGTLASQGLVQELEAAQAAQFPVFCAGLEKQGLKQERRALRIKVRDLKCGMPDAKTLQLTFSLPPGAYATVLLEQLGCFK